MKVKRIIILFATVFLLAFSTTYLSANAASNVLKGYVKANGVNIRSGAGTNYSVIKCVSKKTKVTILNNKKYNKYWYRIKLSDGKKGYIHKDYLRINSNQLYINSTGKGYKGYTCSYQVTNTTKKPVKWSSSNTKIAKVNSKGVISCLKKGNVIITAKAGNKSVSSKLTVNKATVSFSSASATLFTDSKLTLKANCPKSVTYSSSNKSIAKVSSNGVVTPKSEGKVTITAKTLSGTKAKCVVTVKKRVITLSTAKTTMYKGCYGQMKAANGKEAYTYKSSNTNVLTITNSGLMYAVSSGKAKVTCTSGTLSATKTITVKEGSAVNITKTSAEVNKGMTLYIKSSTKDVTWSSSDTSIATVDGGFILGKKKGTAIISAETSKGEATCLVTVKGSNPIRFVYASENSVLPNNSVKFYAITDKLRTAVKFKVTDSEGTISWITNPSKTTEDGRYIWTGSKTLEKAGVWTVVAYSQTSSGSAWSTCDYGQCTTFVNTTTSRKSMSYEKRYATTSLINAIANFEGFLSTVTPDNLAGGIPTVGYGRVIYSGSSFYNGMTKKEAYAYLVRTVNESGFTSQTNKFLYDNKIKFNQRQFDALVDFAYNLGAYALTNHEELSGLLLETYGKASYETKGFVNSLNVVLSKSAEEGAAKIKTVAPGENVTLVSTDVFNEKWYKVKLSDSTTGYMLKSNITMRSANETVRNLNNVTFSSYLTNFLPYHNASGNCYYGLLYRRIDEAEMFFFGDYTVNGKQNNYGISYTCKQNSSFKIS